MRVRHTSPRPQPLLLKATALALLATAALMQLPEIAQAQNATPAAASAPKSKAAVHPKRMLPAHQGALDLHAPPLSHIYAQSQLRYIMAEDSAGDADSADEVSVKGSKYYVPVPAGQIQAIPWAFMHPSQAWRVLTPLESP